MKFGLGIVAFICALTMGEFIYFKSDDPVVIVLAIAAFLPYLLMILGIIFSKKISKKLLGGNPK